MSSLMKVNCEYFEGFQKDFGKVYRCSVKDAAINERGKVIGKFIGRHAFAKRDDDVTMISFANNKNVQFVPEGLITFIKTFENVVALDFSGCSIESITKEDLSGIPNLKWLSFEGNKLTSLPYDLFVETTKLEYINFQNNNISPIYDELLEPLKKLRTAEFGRMALIERIHYKDASRRKKFVTMHKLNEELRENCMSFQNLLVSKLKYLYLEYVKDSSIRMNGIIFKVHRSILVDRSQVFKQIFKENPELYQLEIQNIKTDTFDILLQAMYGVIQEDHELETLKDLLYVAHKLKIPAVKSVVTKMLVKKLDDENEIDLLITAFECEAESLKIKVYKRFNFKGPAKDSSKELRELFTTLYKSGRLFSVFEHQRCTTFGDN